MLAGILAWDQRVVGAVLSVESSIMGNRSPGYLVPYHVTPAAGRNGPVDRGYDPDLTTSPASWGICRTNVREFVGCGTDLFFVAIDVDPDGDPVYSLTSRFRVLKRLHHATARERYGCRQNILLDLLPGSEAKALPDRLLAYVKEHRDRLRWWHENSVVEGTAHRGRAEFMDDIDAGGLVLRSRWMHHVLEWKGNHYAHAWHDHHADWRRRAEAPFLVSDRALSMIAQPSIPFDRVRRMVPGVPDPALSRYGRGAQTLLSARLVLQPD